MWVHEFDDYTTTRTNTTQQSRLLSNNVYEITKAKELVTFLHAALGYPVVDTWVKAIQNNQYATWPGLTSALVYKHLPKFNSKLLKCDTKSNGSWEKIAPAIELEASKPL